MKGLKLGMGAQSDGSWPSARRWRRGCSSGVICENHLVGSDFSESMRTHTRAHTRKHTRFEYPLGKPFETTLLKELYCTLATGRRTSMFLYIPAMYLQLLLALCVAMLLLLQLLLFVTVCGWQNLLLWCIASASSILFLFIPTRDTF